jgi:hypothetical protein
VGARGQHVCVVGSGEVSSVLVITYDNAYDTIGGVRIRVGGMVWCGLVSFLPFRCV